MEAEQTRALYKIALSIASSMDLNAMLDSSLHAFRSFLGLSACGVMFYKVDEHGSLFFETKYSLPHDHNLERHYESAMRFLLAGDAQADIARFESRLPLALLDKDQTHIYLYNLPYVGVLILEKKGGSFGRDFMNEIVPLAARLAVACTGCIRSLELMMVTDGTRELNSELTEKGEDLAESIGQIRAAQEELGKSRNYLALVLQTLSDGLIAADRNGIVRLVNVKAMEYLDFIPDPDETVRIESFFQKAKARVDFTGVFGPAGSGESVPPEIVIVDRRGQERVLRVILNRLDLLLEGEGAYIYLIQDITQLKAVDRMKDSFISNLSHEMRTPMNAILGISKVLASKDAANLTSRQAQGLLLIHDSGSRLLSLINDMLDLSKIEAGKMEIVPHPFSLSELLAHIKEFIVPLASDRVAFSLDSHPGLPSRVDADENRIRQVLVNLLGNAFKFTEDGFVRLHVSAESGSLYFSVADSGMGIPENDLAQIFERFKQLDSSASRKHQGTGIGLALSKELVLLMGGTISAESIPGSGTTLHFSVPYGAVEDAVSAGIADPGIADSFPAGSPRRKVLVAEDESIGRETFDYLLSGDYDLVFAANGEEAVELCSSLCPGLVLMDIMMPGLDGFGALKKIRELPGCKKVPVIAVTARAMKGDRERILDAGFDGYVPKPIDGELLVQEIERFFPDQQH